MKDDENLSKAKRKTEKGKQKRISGLQNTDGRTQNQGLRPEGRELNVAESMAGAWLASKFHVTSSFRELLDSIPCPTAPPGYTSLAKAIAFSRWRQHAP
jgi:hypothetical protein